MKSKINPLLRFISPIAAVLTLTAPAAFADTIVSSVDLRVGTYGSDTSALSLYNDGGGNVQRTFLNFNLSSYSGNSVTTDATLTLNAGVYGDFLTGVSLGTANSAWTQAGITWSNQPGITAIAGATNPSGTFGSGPVTWTIPWYMLEKLATTGSGYNNGLGITSGSGSSQHFTSTAGGGAPALTFSAATGASSTWTGGNGNWTDTANWAGSTVAEGIDQTATIDGVTAVNATMDANRSVGALSFSGADHSISSGSGKLALNVTAGSPTITVETARIATIGATVVGIDGLTKAGDGTLTLTGTNTYTGGTTVSIGTLISTNLNTWKNNVAIASGATFNWNIASNQQVADTAGNYTVSGAGLLAISGGALQNFGNNTPVVQFNLSAGGQMDVQGSGTIVEFGYGHNSMGGNLGSLNVEAGASYRNSDTNAVVDALTGSGIVGNAYNASFTLTVGASNTVNNATYGVSSNTATFSGVIKNVDGFNGQGTGPTNLIKAGTGTQILSGANTYTGTTNVNSGTLVYQNTYASGSHAISSGATLEINVASGTRNSASTTFSGAGTLLKSGNGDLLWQAPTATFALGAGSLIDVQGGTFTGGSNGNENWTSNLCSLNVASAATFNGVEANVRVDALTGDGTIKSGYSGAGYANFTFGVNDGSGNFSGVLADSLSTGNFVKSGTGTQIFSGINTYSGNTTVTAGTLELAAGAQLRFVVTDTPASNQVTGAGTATFNGNFNIDASAVSGTTDHTWTLVDRVSLTGESFDPATFSVIGFVDPEDDGVWTMTDAKGDWQFSESTGELALVAAGTDYDAWGAPYGLATGSEGDDTDNDGLSNQEEYAFGLIPNNGASVNPITVQLDKAAKTFSYTRRDTTKTDLTYSVWFSTDLSAWTQDTGATEGAPVLSGEVETVQVTLSTLPGDPLPATLFIQVRAD